jgi:hypothetical protein
MPDLETMMRFFQELPRGNSWKLCELSLREWCIEAVLKACRAVRYFLMAWKDNSVSLLCK